MNLDVVGQLFRPYLPSWLREQIGRPEIQPGFVHTGNATVLYADVSGFTRLTAAFAQQADGAERLHDSLTRHFTALVEAVLAHGGDVVAIAGDALTAWWPDRIDTETAQRCAAAMQTALGALPAINTPSGPFQLDLRIGISAGCVHLALAGLPSHGIHLAIFGPAMVAATTAERLTPPGSTNVADLAALAPDEPPAGPAESEGAALTFEHFLPPSFIERLRLNALIPEYRRCVPAFCAFDLPRRPEDLHRLTAQVQAVVMRWGGWLNEIEVGDKGAVFVLLFGAPLARGDDTSRAVGCCLELRDRGLIRKAGVSVGILFVGPVGSVQRRVYTAQGDDMNLAAHLMERAAPGEILVSGRVRVDIMGRYTSTQPELIVTKGHEEGVPVARVTAAERVAGRGSSSLQRYLPAAEDLVGRERERWALGRAAWEAIAGRPRLALIEGESGIGKSSLIRDLVSHWVGRGLTGLAGECSGGGQATPLLAWRAILLDLCGVDESAGPQAVRAQLARALRSAGASGPGAIQSFARTLSLDDSRSESGPSGEDLEQTVGLAVALIRRELRDRPLLIVIEDAHWADAQSLRLVAELMGLPAAAGHPGPGPADDYPLCLVLSHRPIDGDAPPALNELRRRPEAVRIVMAPLSSSDSMAMIRTLLGVKHLQAELAQHVERHTEGQPLFIKEYLRVLRQQNLIQIEGDSARLERPTVAVQVSNTAQGIIQARVDRLAEPTRLTLKVAAVIGRSFPLRLLTTIHPARPSEQLLIDQLNLLAELQIVGLELDDPDRVYRFKHGITHEVAYTSLLFGQRRELHAAVAGWYEGEYGEEIARGSAQTAVYDLLIDHLRRAEQWARAANYCRRAAEQTARAQTNPAALRYVEQALVLSGDEQERYDLLLLRVAVNSRIGDWSGQADDLAVLDKIGGQQRDPLRAAYPGYFRLRYLLALGMYPAVQAEVPRLDRQLRQAVRGSPDGVWRLLRAGVLSALGVAAAAQGELAQARAIQRRALSLCWAALGQEPRAGGQRARPEPAAGDGGQALERGAPPQVIDAQALAAHCLVQLGEAALALGGQSQAGRCLQRALELARGSGDWGGEIQARIGLAGLLLARGRGEAAQREAAAALSISHAVGDRGGQARALRQMALISASQGDYAEAQRRAWHSLGICSSSRAVALEHRLLGDLAGFAAAQGQHDEAEAARQEAERLRYQWWEGVAAGERVLRESAVPSG